MNIALTAAVTIAVVLGIIAVVSIIVNIVMLLFVIRYGRMVVAWEENIGDSLDMLDERYQAISKILEKPLFRDTPEIRQMMVELSQCRDAVLVIANALQLPAVTKIIPETDTVRHNYGGDENWLP